MNKRLSTQDIYQVLRERILDFDLPPGSRVTETQLAEEYGVSRTPIRAALQRLEAEGYVSVMPRQGCFVRQIDIETLARYYQVRVALEMLALESACTYMPEADLRELAEAWDPAHHAGRSTDPEVMEARDEGFHISLAEGGGNHVLAHYLDDINGHIRVIRRLDFTRNDRIDRTYEEHYAICQHLLNRDLAKAKRAMREHIQRSEQFAHALTLNELAHKRRRRRRPAKGPACS